jgi:cyclohexanone monooxygenase
VLFSNDYYPALNQANVSVVPGSPIAVHADAVVDQAGDAHRSDVIIYATGFELIGSFDRIDIEGVAGRRLRDAWATGARAYNGVAVADFPNMLILLGPNGFVSYTGVVVAIEAQARFAVRAIRRLRSSGATALVVRRDAEQRFENEIRAMFERTVWHSGGCRSWYQTDAPSGTLLWPDSTVRYRWRLRTLRRADFHLLRRPRV